MTESLTRHDCPQCGTDMDPNRAWWWTWHGATCTEACAQALIAARHGTAGTRPASPGASERASRPTGTGQGVSGDPARAPEARKGIVA